MSIGTRPFVSGIEPGIGMGAEMVGEVEPEPDNFSMSWERISLRSLACTTLRQKEYIETRTRAVPTMAMRMGKATAQA